MTMLDSILVLLAAAVVLAGLLSHFRLPSALGYLLLGALLGPHAVGWLPDNETTRFLAELGVIFLLFTIGLEFSVPTLLAARRTVFGLGGLQVVLIAAAGTIISLGFGLEAGAALLIGMALAMSSTAVVLKQLQDRGELSTRLGRLSVGILIFQDLVTLPLLAVLPSLGDGFDGWLVVEAVSAALLAFVGFAWLGRQFVRPVFHWVTSRRSTELFTLSALLTVVAAASVAHTLGLSAPLGAFLAGLVLGETAFRHQIESDLHPFQAVLLGLFFASIGMLLEPQVLFAHWPIIAAVTLTLIVLKTMGIGLLIRLSGYEPRVAYRCGMTLGHSGEFALLLISVALAEGLLLAQVGQIVLASIVLSMFIAPLLIHLSEPTSRLFSTRSRTQDLLLPEQVATQTRVTEDHVIICGFGRTGQRVADMLRRQDRRFAALDLDPAQVRAAQSASLPVAYGDATRGSILDAVGLNRACALVITFDEPRAAEKIICHARATHPSIKILARTRDDAHLDRLWDAGATLVMPEGFEASLMLGAQLLAMLGTADRAIDQMLSAVRMERYRGLGRHPGEQKLADNEGDCTEVPRRLFSVHQATTIGNLLAAIEGLEVTILIRAGVHAYRPPPSATVRPGDVLEARGEPAVLDLVTDYLSKRADENDSALNGPI